MNRSENLSATARIQALQRCGLERFTPLLKTLDHLKRELSPSHLQDLKRCSIDRFETVLHNLSPNESMVRMNMRPAAGGQGFLLGVMLPSQLLVDYFATHAITPDHHAAAARPEHDPLGVLSLLGVLTHYGIHQLMLREANQRSSKSVALAPEQHTRAFRLVGTPMSELRPLIDRALWQGERILLSPRQYQLYGQIYSGRQDYLTELGLILMPDDHGNQFELYVPGIQKRVANPALPKEQLIKFAQGIHQRVERAALQQRRFLVSSDSANTHIRRAYDWIERNKVLSSPLFMGQLLKYGIEYRLVGERTGQVQGIEFFFADQPSQSVTQQVLRQQRSSPPLIKTASLVSKGIASRSQAASLLVNATPQRSTPVAPAPDAPISLPTMSGNQAASAATVAKPAAERKNVIAQAFETAFVAAGKEGQDSADVGLERAQLPKQNTPPEERLDPPPSDPARGPAAVETTPSFGFGRRALPIPSTLRCAINHVVISGQPQPLPSDAKSVAFLKRFDAEEQLEQLGVAISVTVDKSTGDKARHLIPLRRAAIAG